MKIKPVKGRATLTWIGKHPIDEVNYYPALLEEVCNVDDPEIEPTYEDFKSGPNLVFQGDNKEILSTLLVQGFRGKIDLIYIDPPFASGADYVRKVVLRGKKEKLEAEGHSIAEQIQYTDIWANDTYLQFMYERLILMSELLSKKGSIYLHCNPTMSHSLKLLMDEVFGMEQFQNEIVWAYRTGGVGKSFWPWKHDVLLFYSKSSEYTHNALQERIFYKKPFFDAQVDDKGRYFADVYIRDTWDDIKAVINVSKDREDYPTQKPEALIERILQASSNEDSIVLDCFVGSGTTAVAAEKLGRRWIAADLNKGAIQTTMKRIQTCIDEPRGIAHYRINNYDASTHLERRNIIIKKCGVQIDRQAQFFDGTLDGTLVKIVDLTKPLTFLDIQHIKDELDKRPDEERNITVLCYGSESGMLDEIDNWNRLHPINKIMVREIGSEGVTIFEPAQAKVNFEREGQSVTITIADYISPTICDRLDLDRTIFDEHIEDFRAQIDCILIDTDYTGEYFKIVEIDVPEKKEDFIEGEYTVSLPRPEARAAVKIIDMLGEETVVRE